MFVIITIFGVENENRIDSLIDEIDTLTEAETICVAKLEEYPTAFACEAPVLGGVQDWLVDPIAKTLSFAPDIDGILNSRIGEVSDLFDQKLSVGFTFNDPGGNPQVFESSDTGLRWLDRSALRARKSKDDAEGKTFKARCAGRVKVTLTDDELIDLASNYFDWGTTLSDEMYDRKDALHDIAEGAGTDDEKNIALLAYDIETGW